MARVLKSIDIPSGVTVSVAGQTVSIKGSKGDAEHTVHADVIVHNEGETMRFSPANDSKQAMALVGTTRALLNSIFTGVTAGFEKKLELVGVGYRAQAQGKVLNLTLGFSHPVNYEAPEGISFETPSQTEILVKGTDKQQVGQVAAEIRSYRPPEPYKGKGIRYSGERIIRKEAKKK
jgi:large subunit ribosomal protein L6